MPKYLVRVIDTVTYEYEVEAPDEYAAKAAIEEGESVEPKSVTNGHSHMEAHLIKGETPKLVHAGRTVRPIIQTMFPYDIPLCGKKACTRTHPYAVKVSDVTCPKCKRMLKGYDGALPIKV